jgi:uncharacterized protein (DUF1499 family)
VRAVATIDTSPAALPGGRPARWSLLLGLLAPLLAAIGVYLAMQDMASAFVGFRTFALALPLSAVGLIAGWIGLLRARGERNPAAKRVALAGSMLSVLTLSAIIGLALPSASFPLINDITTDFTDPPQFVKCADVASNRGRDMSYPSAFVEQQRAGYPNLDGKTVALETGLAMERVRTALEALPGTKVIDVDVDGGRIEAVSISRVFGFVDDVVVRVRPEGNGSRIDMRSKSRDGKGDLGANAARIETFLLALR